MSEQPVLPIHSKICFLLCDKTDPKFVDCYGDFTNLFTVLYTKLLLRFSGERWTSFLPDVMKSFRLQPFKVYEKKFPDLATIDQYDSIIVSGSNSGVNDGDEWIKELGGLLHTIATQHPKIKLIGICFGHQIICHSVFGSQVVKNPKWEIGPYQVELNELGKKVFRNKEHLNIEMFHHDAVFTKSQLAYFDSIIKAAPYDTTVPWNEYKIWGSTPRTPNQGTISLSKDAPRDRLNVDDIHIFTSQGHPEMTSGMISLLVDIFESTLGSEAVDEGRKRIAEFKGTLDWFSLSLLMWALSTRHSVNLPQLNECADEYLSLLHGLKAPIGLAGADLNSDQSVFVYVV